MRFSGRTTLADGGGFVLLIDHFNLRRIGNVDQWSISPVDPTTNNDGLCRQTVEGARQVGIGREDVLSDARCKIGTVIRPEVEIGCAFGVAERGDASDHALVFSA